jgi:hypothetical protein
MKRTTDIYPFAVQRASARGMAVYDEVERELMTEGGLSEDFAATLIVLHWPMLLAALERGEDASDGKP